MTHGNHIRFALVAWLALATTLHLPFNLTTALYYAAATGHLWTDLHDWYLENTHTLATAAQHLWRSVCTLLARSIE